MKLLALDQSTTFTGWCLMKDKKYNSSGVLSVNKDEDAIERLKLMYDKIVKLINRVKPDIVFIEDVQFQRNYSTYRTLSQLQGVIMAYLFEKDLPFYIVPSTAWKSHCGIKGEARKEQKKNTQIFVKNTYGLDVSEDEADSIGIAHYSVTIVKGGK